MVCLVSRKVAPFVGAWIEIKRNKKATGITIVAPFVGAWIEIIIAEYIMKIGSGRTLCGCVD